jgi:hypothetical protein
MTGTLAGVGDVRGCVLPRPQTSLRVGKAILSLEKKGVSLVGFSPEGSFKETRSGLRPWQLRDIFATHLRDCERLI